MKIELELWHLVTLLLAFFSCVWTFGVVLLGQIEKRLDERFKAQEETRKESQQHWDQKFAAMEASAKEWVRLERDFLDFNDFLEVADAMVDYKVSKNVSLRLNVYNLFDEDYISTLNNSGARATLGAPRSAMLSANVQF